MSNEVQAESPKPQLNTIKFIMEAVDRRDVENFHVVSTVLERMFQWIVDQGHSVEFSQVPRLINHGPNFERQTQRLELSFRARILADGHGETRQIVEEA